MKPKYPFRKNRQTTGSSDYFSWYRSVILTISGSLFCAAAAGNAAAQSTYAPIPLTDIALLQIGESSIPIDLVNGEIKEGTLLSPQIISPYVSSSFQAETNAPTEALSTNVAPASTTPATTATDSGTSPNPAATPPPVLQQPKVHKNEVSASADFMYGTGTITVPIGYGFRASTGGNFPVDALSANRSTVYFGGTASYSYGRSWYLDFWGGAGRSTGGTSISIPNAAGTIPADFNYDDVWYQAYLRYNFPNFLAGTPFRAYLRGGVSFVDATMTLNNNTIPSFGPGQYYSEHDNTFDYLGNLGFGLSYAAYSTIRLKVGLQMEGEGFGGVRSQDIDESFGPSNIHGSTTIHNTLYGGIGRLTLHMDYRLGQAGRWKLTADAGMMTKYNIITYPDASNKSELLYGPYVKVGASFVF